MNLYFTKLLEILFIALITIPLIGQNHTKANGLKISVITCVSTIDLTTNRRFEIATAGYNSYSWQDGGIILIELYHQYYGIANDLNTERGKYINWAIPTYVYILPYNTYYVCPSYLQTKVDNIVKKNQIKINDNLKYTVIDKTNIPQFRLDNYRDLIISGIPINKHRRLIRYSI